MENAFIESFTTVQGGFETNAGNLFFSVDDARRKLSFSVITDVNVGQCRAPNAPYLALRRSAL